MVPASKFTNITDGVLNLSFASEIATSPNFISTVKPEALVSKNSKYSAELKDSAELNESYKMLSYISHELRTTVHGLSGSVSTLTNSRIAIESLLQTTDGQSINPKLRDELLRLFEQQREATHTMNICVKQQTVIVNDVLDHAKLRAGEVKLCLTVMGPKKIIDDVINMLKTTIMDKKLELSINIVHDENLVIGDVVRLRQVLLNLLTNAIKFTPENGKITVSLRKSEVNDENSILQYSVEDTGIGLGKEEMQRICKPFQQANDDTAHLYGGTGLGLSISKGLIELMGGSLKINSEKGKGSTFTFSAKCNNAPKLPPKPRSPLIFSINPPAKEQNKQILIADDNPINQKLLKQFLVGKGYNCEIANNGQEAVELCGKKHFAIILMDACMPVLNGMEAAQAIRKNANLGLVVNPRIRIIALSATTPTKGFIEDVHKSGMDDWLVKPYGFKDLLEKLEIYSEGVCQSSFAISNSSSASTSELALNESTTSSIKVASTVNFTQAPPKM